MENLEGSVPATARTEHFATDEIPFHFADSGLSNVFLVGIRYFTNPTGEVFAEIPAVEDLMRLIARDVVYSKESLSGEQIRFLRKRLGLKSIEFAESLRLDNATISRFENDKQPPSPQVDLLIRMSYILLCGDPALASESEKLKQEIVATIRRSEMKIVMRIDDGNEWHELKPAA